MEMDKRPHKERYEMGLKTRTEVLGREWVEKSMAGVDDFNREGLGIEVDERRLRRRQQEFKRVA